MHLLEREVKAHNAKGTTHTSFVQYIIWSVNLQT